MLRILDYPLLHEPNPIVDLHSAHEGVEVAGHRSQGQISNHLIKRNSPYCLHWRNFRRGGRLLGINCANILTDLNIEPVSRLSAGIGIKGSVEAFNLAIWIIECSLIVCRNEAAPVVFRRESFSRVLSIHSARFPASTQPGINKAQEKSIVGVPINPQGQRGHGAGRMTLLHTPTSPVSG